MVSLKKGLGLHAPLRKWHHKIEDPTSSNESLSASKVVLSLLEYNNFTKGKYLGELSRSLLQSNQTRAHKTEYPTHLLVHPQLQSGVPWLTGLQSTGSMHSLGIYGSCRYVVEEDKCMHYNCTTIACLLKNTFEPMFIATLYPERKDYINISRLLFNIGSISVNSDEMHRKIDLFDDELYPEMAYWKDKPDDYYLFYYIWSNLYVLNYLRRQLGYNTIDFRPNSGEVQPHFDQLVCSYLLADGVNHGLGLHKSWALQYLYMFSRIPISMSPLSHNVRINYLNNPFHSFFKRGLHVALSTTDPLHTHTHKSPLDEEYTMAKRNV